MRNNKYPNLGIMDFIEKKLYGNVSKFEREKLYQLFNNDKPLSRASFSKKIYAIKRHGFIEYSNDQEFTLTRKGLERINFIRFEKLTIPEKKRDGLWRLIIFDVPERQRGARDLLRNKLIELEFFQLQKSTYLTPFICEKEISELSKILGISRYISIILAKSIGNREKEIEKHFR